MAKVGEDENCKKDLRLIVRDFPNRDDEMQKE